MNRLFSSTGMHAKTLARCGVALVLILELVGVAFTYARGYRGLVSDDPALAVTGARYQYELRTTRFPNPLTPLLGTEFYSNFIASEYPVHTALSQLYLLVGVEHILTVTNIFMVVLFAAAGLSIAALFFALTRSAPLTLLGVPLLLTSRWYGISFWTGHYAQILAALVVPIILLGLVRYEQERRRRWLFLACALTLLLFPIHSLSFLVATSAVLGVLLVRVLLLGGSARVRLLLGVSTLLAFAAALLIVKTRFTEARYYPLFSVQDVGGGTAAAILRGLLPEAFAALLVLVGIVGQLQRRRVALVSWFLVTYVLVNSGFLQIPFFQYRFIEFMAMPIALLAVLGVQTLLRLLRRPALRMALLAGVAALAVPLNAAQQLELRACHVKYCEGLHPVSLPEEDASAFLWLRDNTPSDALIVAAPKFGVYIPALALRNVESPWGTQKEHNESYVVMTSRETERRWESARAIGASYVVWDAVFDRYGATYAPYRQYTERFGNPKRFRRVYNRSGVRIYRVLP